MIALDAVFFSSELRSWLPESLQILLIWQDWSQWHNRDNHLDIIYGTSKFSSSANPIFQYVTFDWRHAWSGIVINWTCVLQSSLACSVLASASGCFVRFSLFFFYLRLFKPNNITRLLIYGGMLASGIFYTSAIITPCVLYIPPPGWPRTSEGWLLRAFNSNDAALGLALAQSVFGTIIDIYLLVIPIRSVFQLQLPTRRKFGVSSIFMIGIMWAMSSFSSWLSQLR